MERKLTEWSYTRVWDCFIYKNFIWHYSNTIRNEASINKI